MGAPRQICSRDEEEEEEEEAEGGERGEKGSTGIVGGEKREMCLLRQSGSEWGDVHMV